MVGVEVGQEPGLALDAALNAAPKLINDERRPRHLVPLWHRHLWPATVQMVDILQRLKAVVVAMSPRKKSSLF